MRIILAPDSDTSSEVLARLKSWSGSRLLQPFCWWTVTIPSAGAEPLAPSMDVEKVDRGHGLVIHLGAALAGEDPTKTRLVALYSATRAEGYEADFATCVEQHVVLAANILAFDPGQPPECTMVVAPLDIGQPLPADLFRPNWSSNIYVAPEDRSAPTDANQLNAWRFPAHAAHALACVGDLWAERRGDDPPTLIALSARQAPMVPPLVQVVRCFSRIIDFGFLPDHLASAVFRNSGEWPNPDPDRFERVPMRVPVATRLVDEYMVKHREVLGLSAFDPIILPVPPKLTLWQALRLLMNELVAWILRKPFDLAEQVVASLYDAAATRIERLAGPDSDVRARGVKRWFDQDEAGRSLATLAADVDDLLLVPDGLVAPAWVDLRSLSFGLIDGAALPDGIDDSPLRHQAKRGVITNPGVIVPDPAMLPPLPEGVDQGRACDPLRFDPTFSEAETPAPRDEQAERIANWVDDRRNGVAWMIGVRIGAALVLAREEASRSVPHPTQEEVAQEEVQRKLRLKRIRRRFRLAFVGATAAALLGGWLAWRELSLPARIPTLLVIPILWLVAIAIAGRRARLRREAERRAVLARELGILNSALLRAQRAGDEIRLGRRYAEYLDWAEIIGWVAHRPWVGEPLRRVDVPNPVDVASLPAALSIASGQPGEEGMNRARSIARAEIFQSRWLATLYGGVEDNVMEDREQERKAIDDLQASVERKDPAGDTSEDPDSPRRSLVVAVRAGRYRELNANPMTRDLLRLIDGLPIDAISEGVVPILEQTGSAQALPPSANWFEPPANLGDLAERLRPSIVRIETATATGQFGGTGVIVSTAGVVATSHHVVDGAEAIKVQLADGTITSATLMSSSSIADLALLTLDSPLSLAPAVLSDDEPTIEQGEPVISLGHPKLLDGEPTLAWGFITAARRRIRPTGYPKGVEAVEVIQATYQSAGGASGSPVFDLDGQVIGIHCSGSAEAAGDLKASYLSNAVPVAQLRALLSAASAAPSASQPQLREGFVQPPELVRASQFLAEFETEGATAMLPGHWVDPDDANRIHETISSRSDGASLQPDLPYGPAYRAPLRVLSHQIDLARPVVAIALSSCEGQ